MEVHECDDAVHTALKQRRPKLIVDIINKVRHLRICRASLYCSLYCDNGADGVTRARVFLQHLVEEAEQADAAGTTKKKSIDFVCIECKNDGPEGRARAFFSAPPPTIVFCANRLHSAREVEETMVHELIHAYDFTVRKMDITKSDLLACSEIRSARESECYQKAHILASMLPDVEFFRKSSSWLHTRCVREHAVRSTKSMFPNQARAEVDKMFDQCYHDKSPFPQ